MSTYERPQSLAEALLALAKRPRLIIAGATDVYPADANRQGWGRAAIGTRDDEHFLDISAIDPLRRIEMGPESVEMGSNVTWTDVREMALPAWFDALRLAAREVGGPQIQNRATIAGNLCNASPAADGVPPLLALNARVRLNRVASEREIPLSEFITGNRSTTLAPDELLTAIVVPNPTPASQSTFVKLGARKYLVISIAMVAVVLAMEDRVITDVRIAVGACSAVAQRLHDLEQRLVGVAANEALRVLRDTDFAVLTPIDDVRATAEYRRHAARVLVQRALAALAGSEAPDL
jgi:CO/xanthine dehydrogenase FAD-binding subunit